MAQRICSIEGCSRPHRCRGFCGRHYDAWKRHGDPLANGPYRRRTGKCDVPTCNKPDRAQGLCDSHYKLNRKYGTPNPRLRAEVVNGRKICADCKQDTLLADLNAQGVYCRPCAAKRTMRYYVPPPTTKTPCGVCGLVFGANKRRKYYCSASCSKIALDAWQLSYAHRRRALLASVTVEDFDITEIYERDGWICQICMEPIDPSLKGPHPRSKSIDHIVPLARGGEHSRANTQAAHLSCNCRKGAKLLT